MYATPPAPNPNPPMKNGRRFWKTSQNGRNHFAGMRIICQKNPSMRNVRILTRGNMIRYAPSMPDMAPDAPTAGTELAGSIAMWASPAATPHPRYIPRNFRRPNLCSMLSPNIHRKSMLPPRCIRPPCRNVEVISVRCGEDGQGISNPGCDMVPPPVTQLGTAPHSKNSCAARALPNSQNCPV